MNTLARCVTGFMFGGILAVLFISVLLAGCSTTPALSPVSSFERCVKVVAGDSILIHERIRAAEWCAEKVGNP